MTKDVQHKRRLTRPRPSRGRFLHNHRSIKLPGLALLALLCQTSNASNVSLDECPVLHAADDVLTLNAADTIPVPELLPPRALKRVAAQPLIQGKTLVIIIDDLGNNLRQGKATAALPGKVNMAVLPYTPHGVTLAKQGHRAGKEILLHAPMSNLGNLPLGPGALTPELSEQEFKSTLAANIRHVPHIRGINNHMGSDLTQRSRQMNWVMQELNEQQLYFVDSRTSGKSIAAATASQHGIPHLTRHVFLDNERNTAAIARRFREVLQAVDNQGLAVAIGHPYPETIDFLQRVLPLLHQRGIKLAYVSEVLGLNRTTVAQSSPHDEQMAEAVTMGAPTGPDSGS